MTTKQKFTSPTTYAIVLDGDAPKKYQDIWINLQKFLEYSCKKQDTIKRNEFGAEILKHCELKSNNALSVIDRAEFGFGGNDNNKHKQARCKINPYLSCDNHGRFGSIQVVFDNPPSRPSETDELENWTLEETNDIMKSFARQTNLVLEGHNCVSVYRFYDVNYDV